MMSSVSKAVAPRRGRPRKFAGPSRAVTLTLPDHILDSLAAIDPDLSRAIVRLAEPTASKRLRPSAELAAFGRHAVIVVHPSRTLERRTGVVLVPLPDGRALISFGESQTVPELELQLQDLLEDPQLTAADQRIFEEISHILRDARRSRAVSIRRHHIIVFESAHRARRRPADRTTRSKPRQRMSS
jgi:hypothetical protein